MVVVYSVLILEGSERGHVDPPKILQINQITQLFPNSKTLDINWDSDLYDSDIPIPKAKTGDAAPALKRLGILNPKGSDALEVCAMIGHLNPPILEELEVKVNCYEEIYRFAYACEKLNAILSFGSRNLKCVIVHVELNIFVPPTTTVWVSAITCARTRALSDWSTQGACSKTSSATFVKSTNVESIRISAENALMDQAPMLESLFTTNSMRDVGLVKTLVRTKSRVMAWFRGLKYYRR
jgi:hypothetical protein